ncbi:spore germination protein [Salicibibacter cibarius]|uniref:spore germination protein n=1 Tax=Salicibibacter cibarius TaxID=2743000 RepID=UPI002484642E|nr:spore germination protein [Salicibibacter cibarius]
MAAIHTPGPLESALGVVAALIIGDMAIDIGFFTREVLFYVAVGAIGMYMTPSYEFGLTLRILRYMLIIAIVAFGPMGFVFALFLSFIWIVSMRPYGKPYLWPFLPFDPYGMYEILVRTAIPSEHWRPAIVDAKDKHKQRSMDE